QVGTFVSILTSPVVHVVSTIMHSGAANEHVEMTLQVQCFIAFTVVAMIWTIRDMLALQSLTHGYSSISSIDGIRPKKSNVPSEMCVILAAETLIAQPSCNEEGDIAATEAIRTMVKNTVATKISCNTPVLQTTAQLLAWRQVLVHQHQVEEDIHEVDHCEEHELALVDMNSGMPSLVCIVQGVFIGTAQLEHSVVFGGQQYDGPLFWVSLGMFGLTAMAVTVQMLRMHAIIGGAKRNLQEAIARTEIAMESFKEHHDIMGELSHREVGCLSHIAARKGMWRTLQCLLQYGASPNTVNSLGQTPIDVAVEAGMDQ
ncbi:unnamed protein product, partial [Choristocarpus tenellus]